MQEVLLRNCLCLKESSKKHVKWNYWTSYPKHSLGKLCAIWVMKIKIEKTYSVSNVYMYTVQLLALLVIIFQFFSNKSMTVSAVKLDGCIKAQFEFNDILLEIPYLKSKAWTINGIIHKKCKTPDK